MQSLLVKLRSWGFYVVIVNCKFLIYIGPRGFQKVWPSSHIIHDLFGWFFEPDSRPSLRYLANIFRKLDLVTAQS